MSRPVTVKFADGTTHIYEDVPDEISDDQVQERAGSEFGKEIERIGEPPAAPAPTTGEKTVAGAQTAVNVATGVFEHPIVQEGLKYGAELYGAKKLILDPILNKFPNPGPVQPTPTPAAQALPQAVNGPVAASPAPAAGNQIRFPGPNVTPPAQAQPSMLQQGMEYANKVKQLAMEKLMSGPGLATKAGLGAAALLTSANQNQNYPVPQSGPYRGMEINPMTHRPWTQQELMQFNR